MRNLPRNEFGEEIELPPRWREAEHNADRTMRGQPPEPDRPVSTSTEQLLLWASPDLSYLGTGRRAAPAFPLALLGSFWAEWTERKAEAASAPVDYVATSLLGCAGAMLGNVRWPMAGPSWSEPPIIWAGLVGSPSSGKSPGMDAVFELVRAVEDQMASGFAEKLRQHDTEKEVAEACREAWKSQVKAAIKNGGEPPSMPLEADPPEPPVRPRVRVADVTIEKLGALAAALPRGLLLVRDELTGWLGSFDRYGGNGSDRAFSIESYGGRSYSIDRVKNPEPLNIRHLSIGLLGGVQPDKLQEVINGPDDGLASRILWSWPDVNPGFRLARVISNDIEAKNAFGKFTALTMAEDLYGNPEPKRLRLEPAAENEIEAFGQEVAIKCNDASGIHAGALGKARGHVLRIACILEHLWWCGGDPQPEPDRISVKAVRAAAGLVDGYFVPMAERVLGDASIPLVERRAMVLARQLRSRQHLEFNARTLRREVGGLLRESAAMDEACAVLVEASLIRLKTGRPGQSGRPAKVYDVNPLLLTAS